MKKTNQNFFLPTVILVSLFLFLALPLFSQPAFAAPCDSATKLCIFGEKIECDPSLPPVSGGCDFIDFIQTIKAVIAFLVKLAIPLASVFILYGGFVIMTASGSVEKAATGKKVVTAAVWGLIILFGAWLILFTVFEILKSVSNPTLTGIRTRLFNR